MSDTLSKWIVGSDGSEGSDRAVEWCVGYAPGRTTKLHVLRAWHVPTASLPEGAMMDLEDFEPAEALHDFDVLAQTLAQSGVEATSSIEFGGAAERLTSASEDRDLLVVGSRGRGGFARLLLGSVSSQCAAHARVPVAVVPDHARTDGGLRRVVVGIDGSPGSASALDWAIDFTPADVPIVAVGAGKPPRWSAGMDRSLLEQMNNEMDLAFHKFIDRVLAETASDRAVERMFRAGHPAETLVEVAGDADLIVVGERGHRGISAAILGSVTMEVLHRAPCTTVVVPVPSVGDAT
jgi:nucleotide-binding universal stress UspA family protein